MRREKARGRAAVCEMRSHEEYFIFIFLCVRESVTFGRKRRRDGVGCEKGTLRCGTYEEASKQANQKEQETAAHRAHTLLQTPCRITAIQTTRIDSRLHPIRHTALHTDRATTMDYDYPTTPSASSASTASLFPSSPGTRLLIAAPPAPPKAASPLSSTALRRPEAEGGGRRTCRTANSTASRACL